METEQVNRAVAVDPPAMRNGDLATPVAEPRPAVRQFSGVEIDDPYAWLEDASNPEVIAHLKAENAYTEAMMAPTAAGRETLYKEMVGRVQRTDTRVPFRMGDWFYYVRTEEGRDYDILCRKRGSLDAPEEILLDLNQIAAGYLALGHYAPSGDHRYLAFALNETGGMEYTISIKDLQTGDVLPDRLPNDGEGFAWAADHQTLFYVRQDDTLRSCDLHRHTLGADPATDPRLFHEDDPVFSVTVYPSDSGSFIFLASESRDTSDVRYLPANTPTADLTLFAARRPGIEYALEHHGDAFLVLTNEDAVNFRLLAVPVAEARRDTVRELIPHRERVLLKDIDVFADHLLISGREDGLSRLWIHHLASGETRPVAFEEPVHTVSVGDNREFNTSTAVIGYSSFVTPPSYYALDLATGERTLLKQEPVLGGYNPDDYLAERLFATARDGTRIPISLLRRRDAPPGPRPLLLRGYGAYGISMDPRFARNELSLVDRGVTLALAHVRGGQELGRPWYEGGRLLHKQNTFDDFIACAEHLVQSGYTAPDRLVAQGRSAGGLLMGAVANARPDLFHAIVAGVPFVDVVRSMLDPRLPLTTGEFVEWGDPRVPEFRAYIGSYSPYDNVVPQAYPHLFITAGIEDDQVPFWQPAKWTARLRATRQNENFLLLRTNLGAGHRGDSGFYDHFREIAFDYAFVLMSLGIPIGD